MKNARLHCEFVFRGLVVALLICSASLRFISSRIIFVFPRFSIEVFKRLDHDNALRSGDLSEMQWVSSTIAILSAMHLLGAVHYLFSKKIAFTLAFSLIVNLLIMILIVIYFSTYISYSLVTITEMNGRNQ